jgi:hypothetical protein
MKLRNKISFLKDSVSIYTNPCVGIAPVKAPRFTLIKIFETSGKFIQTITLLEEDKTQINLVPGNYFLQFFTDSPISSTYLTVK